MIGIGIIIFLIFAVGWIARMARIRGASPWLFGGLALAGWLTPFFLGNTLAQQLRGSSGGTLMAAEILFYFAPWALLGVVALYVRFIPGRQRPQPFGRWTCPECHWLNAAGALQCDACQAPYSGAVETQ
jgi:hypothetical protein